MAQSQQVVDCDVCRYSGASATVPVPRCTPGIVHLPGGNQSSGAGVPAQGSRARQGTLHVMLSAGGEAGRSEGGRQREGERHLQIPPCDEHPHPHFHTQATLVVVVGATESHLVHVKGCGGTALEVTVFNPSSSSSSSASSSPSEEDKVPGKEKGAEGPLLEGEGTLGGSGGGTQELDFAVTEMGHTYIGCVFVVNKFIKNRKAESMLSLLDGNACLFELRSWEKRVLTVLKCVCMHCCVVVCSFIALLCR